MKRMLVLLALLALASALVWWRGSIRPPPAAGSDNPPDAAAAPPAAEPEPTPAAYDPAFDRLNGPDQTIVDDLRLLHDIFARYRLFVKDPSGNPAGTHEEIVRALQGRNRAGLAFLPARHPALNERNELVDRWGTPFFFHALAGAQMEIRSAGPDRRMWTEDDALYPPRERSAPAKGAARGDGAGAAGD